MEILQRILIIASLNVWFFARTVRYKYASDDVSAFRNPPKFKNKWHKLWLEFKGVGRFDEKTSHLMTITIHALICVFIYLGFGRNDVSYVAALLYTFNPANNQASIWTGGRGYALPALSLVMSASFPLLAPLFLLGGCYYTAGYVAPLVFLLSPYWWFIIFMPAIWWVWRKKFKTAVLSKYNTETFTEDRIIAPRKFILATKTYGYYLTWCIVPFVLSFYHPFLQSAAGSLKKRAYAYDKFFFIGVVGILCTISSLILRHPTSWGLWWFMIGIAPYSNFKRVNQEIAERFAFIANIGLMIALANIITPYPIVVASFLGFYATRLWFYMPCYTDDYWITEYAVCETPDAWFAWHMRAVKRWEMGSHHEALNMWVMCNMLNPNEFKILCNLASILFMLRRDIEAKEFLKLAEKNIVSGQEKSSMEILDSYKKGYLPILT